MYDEVKSVRAKEFSEYDEADAVKKMVMRLSIHGILKYGAVLCIVEISTLGSILMFKLMIDYLQNPSESSIKYAMGIFAVFSVCRMITIFSRSYYDLHVYNYYRFV